MRDIQTKRLRIRALTSDDAEPLSNLANNRKIWLNLRDRFPHPYTLEKASDFIAMLQKEEDAMVFAIVFEGDLVGLIGLHPQVDVYAKSAELGYWVGEPYWGKGIITKAIAAVTKYGFQHRDWNRIYAGVYDYNPASMRALEKNGFLREGILRKAVFKDGQFADEHRYSLLREDLPIQ
ncbi:MAG: GNAT family N-acetyltransferase [Saprospiraceae bacterium]